MRAKQRHEITRSDKTNKLMKTSAEYQEGISDDMMFYYEKRPKYRNTAT